MCSDTFQWFLRGLSVTENLHFIENVPTDILFSPLKTLLHWHAACRCSSVSMASVPFSCGVTLFGIFFAIWQ
jgi:hypothetical protein